MKCSPTTTLYVEPIFQKVVLLGGGFKHVFFHPNPCGKWSNLTLAYFSGWEKNHQLVKVLKCHSPSDFCSPKNPSTSWEWYWNLYIYPVGFCHRFLFQVFLLEPSPQCCAKKRPTSAEKNQVQGKCPQNPWTKTGGIILVCPEKMWLFSENTDIYTSED